MEGRGAKPATRSWQGASHSDGGPPTRTRVCTGPRQSHRTPSAGWGKGTPEPFCHMVLWPCPTATSQLQLHHSHQPTTHTHNSFINVYFHLNQQMNTSIGGRRAPCRAMICFSGWHGEAGPGVLMAPFGGIKCPEQSLHSHFQGGKSTSSPAVYR